MYETVAAWIVWLSLAYAGAGLVFAVAFAFKGAHRIDPAAEGGTLGFRLLIIPGAAALWPLLLRRWLTGTQPPEECSAHRRAASATVDEEPGT